MDTKCAYKYCYAPESPCNLGEADFNSCPHWKEAIENKSVSEAVEGSGLLPWSGNSFGTVDREIVTGRSKPRIIGVVGAHDAGKTTLLTVLYLLLTHGRKPEGRSFAGSYTLGGWENLATFLRWKEGEAPRFPPHTASNSGREPGLLHVGFRNNDGEFEDVLFTDAPGEWFDDWAANKSAARSDGPRWISRFADSFMLFVDSEKLAGAERGQVRARLITLAERLANEAGDRPIAVVWAKSDIEVPHPIVTALENKFRMLFRTYKEFKVSIHTENGQRRKFQDPFLELLGWLLCDDRNSITGIPHLQVLNANDPFLAFRGA